MKNTLLIRADAYSGIGIGHVMRCLALAQAWQEKGREATFASSMLSPKLRARLRSEGIICAHIPSSPGSAFDALQTAELAMIKNADWVVVDGYHFGSDYQRIVKESGRHVLFVDDNRHAGHYYADLVLNQNLHADGSLYINREPHTRLLLGTDYVLLRSEFRRMSRSVRAIPNTATKLLITLGGSDPDNVTSAVVTALQKANTGALKVKVVVGANYMYYNELLSCASESKTPMQLVINPTNMPELMMWADLAISGAGTTCWEMAYLGLPGILLIIADNQRASAEELHRKETFVTLNGKRPLDEAEFLETFHQLLYNKERRETLSWNASQMVDGQGVFRVLEQVTEPELVEA
jgi:UDP-2,4-diacetamido-2,4,6-trideoxy-beta-L-altropyranose hydrolase